MTRDQIIQWAREANPFTHESMWSDAELAGILERFAALVAAAERTENARHFQVAMEQAVKAEREECAKVCDSQIDAEYQTGKVDHNEMAWTQACAIAIRARGQA